MPGPETDRITQRAGFDIWLYIEIPAEPRGKVLVHAHRAGAVSLLVEQLDEASDGRLVIRVEHYREPSRLGGAGNVAQRRPRFRCTTCGTRPQPFEPAPFPLQPCLERWGTREVESRKQLAPIETQRLVPRLPIGGPLEVDRIALKPSGSQPQFFIAPIDQHPVAERMPEMVDGFVQGVPRPCIVEFRPEQGKEEVSTDETARRTEGDVGQERQSLWLD